MRTIKILGLLVCFIAIGLFFAAFVGLGDVLPKKNIARVEGEGFAVLELFTSEGCSSCPPADQVLAKIEKEADDKAVYLLAYHVDYWDRQGWKDSFSSADYSERQAQYGRWFNLSTIYTPQLVVNGKKEFAGSDERAIRNAIVGELSAKPEATLTLETTQRNEGLIVAYHAVGAIKGTDLLITVVQKTGHSKVIRGENAGRELSHVQIVRKLQVVELSGVGDGSAVITLPEDLNHQDWEILGLIQNKNNGKILGAAKAIIKKS